MKLVLEDAEGMQVQLSVSELKVQCQNNVAKFRDVREAEIAYFICAAGPEILSYEEIDTKILRRFDVGQQSQQGRMQYLHNKMSSIRKRFNAVVGNSEVIRTIRGSGYQLVERWVVKEQPATTGRIHLLGRLENVVVDLVSLSREMELTERAAGNQTVLMLESKGFSERIASIEQRYDEVTTLLLGSIDAPKHPQVFEHCWTLVKLIKTYVLFQRQGRGIDEQTWKELFQKELAQHVNIFRTILLSGESK